MVESVSSSLSCSTRRSSIGFALFTITSILQGTKQFTVTGDTDANRARDVSSNQMIGVSQRFILMFRLAAEEEAKMTRSKLAILMMTLPLLLVEASVGAPREPMSAPHEINLTGMVTDSMCGAKHMMSGDDAACVRKCVKGGSHYALSVGEKVYPTAGQEEVLNKLAGETVNVSGMLNPDGVIKLASLQLTGKSGSVKTTKQQNEDKAASRVVAIQGLIRDVACPIQNKKAYAREFNLQCAIDCAKLGSPLILLTDNGTIYTPISSSMPDEDQRNRLMPFVGKYVQIRGQVYERRGTHAIVIQDIKELPDVHLVTDAK